MRRVLHSIDIYQRARVMTFLDPWSAARGKGYQTVQAFLALGGVVVGQAAFGLGEDLRAAPAGDAVLAADEAALPFADASLDLVVSALALQFVNDLPGTLIQIRLTPTAKSSPRR